MIILELGLIAVGAIFVIASFFLTDKLSPKDLTEIADRSEKEMKAIMDKEMTRSEDRIREMIDETVEGSLVKVDRALDKETNERIKGISEYSDTVMQDLNKLHEEVLFLYSMLNDRHDEMTKTAGEIEGLVKEVNAAREWREEELRPEEEMALPEPSAGAAEELILPAAEEGPSTEPEPVPEPVNPLHERIRALADEGKTAVEIAEELDRGVGEVQLVLALSSRKEDGADET